MAVVKVEGKQGLAGRDGPQGKRGPQGILGPEGKQGKQGVRGPEGPKGRDGGTAAIEHSSNPEDVAAVAVAGTSLLAAAANHVHKGLRSIRAGSDPQLFGNVVLAAGDNVTLTQVANTITIETTGGGGGTLTDTFVGFGDASNVLTGSSDFTYDGSTLKLAAVDGSAISLAFTRAGGQIIEKQGTGFFAIGTLGSEELAFYTDNVNRLEISDVGIVNVDIALTIGSPTSIDYYGPDLIRANGANDAQNGFTITSPNTGDDTAAAYRLQVGPQDGSAGAFAQMKLRGTGDGETLEFDFFSVQTGGGAPWYFTHGNDGSESNIIFRTTTSWIDRLKIAVDGVITLGASSTGLEFNPATNVLKIGIATAQAQSVFHTKAAASAAAWYCQNATTTGYEEIVFGESDSSFAAVGYLVRYNSAFVTAGVRTAGTYELGLTGGSGNMLFALYQASGDYIFATTTSDTERMRITNAGNIQFGATSANRFDSATSNFYLGAGPWISSGQKSLQFTRNHDGATHIVATNNDAGTSVSTGFVMSLESAITTLPYAAFSLFGANYSGIPAFQNGVVFELGNSTAGDIVFSNLAATTGGIKFKTTASRLDRLTIANGGNVAIPGADLLLSKAGDQSIDKSVSGDLFIVTDNGGQVVRFVGNSGYSLIVGDTSIEMSSLGTPGGYVKAAASSGALTSVTSATANADIGHDYDSWFHTQVTLMKAQVPQLTNFVEIKPGEYALGDAYNVATFANFASTYEGGGLSTPSNAYHVLGTPVFQTAKTGKWAMAFRAKMPVPAGLFAFVGFMSLGTVNSLVGVVSYAAMDATKWRLYTWENPTEIGVATSTSADANMHDFLLTFDTTTIKLYIDGVLEASQTTLTYLTDGPRALAHYSQTHGDTHVVRVMYGYIAP